MTCGTYVVVEFYEGLERIIRYCERTDGPCPFPGAKWSSRVDNGRGCAAENDKDE